MSWSGSTFFAEDFGGGGHGARRRLAVGLARDEIQRFARLGGEREILGAVGEIEDALSLPPDLRARVRPLELRRRVETKHRWGAALGLGLRLLLVAFGPPLIDLFVVDQELLRCGH